MKLQTVIFCSNAVEDLTGCHSDKAGHTCRIHEGTIWMLPLERPRGRHITMDPRETGFGSQVTTSFIISYAEPSGYTGLSSYDATN
jgi:hypothetical protein